MWQVLLFGVVPILGATATILAILAVIYWKVRSQRRRSREWNFGGTMEMAYTSSTSAQTYLNAISSTRSSTPTRAINDRSEWEVFFQCTAYALSFGLSWPLVGAILWLSGCVYHWNWNLTDATQVVFAQFKVYDDDLPYWVWLLAFCVAPLQGFNNALCYFRPFNSSNWKHIRCPRFSVIKGCVDLIFYSCNTIVTKNLKSRD